MSKTSAKRFQLFSILFCVSAAICIGIWAYQHFYASKHASTDNAYVHGNIAKVSPSVGALVKDILVSDADMVQQGDVIVILENSDYRIALAKAKADLAVATIQLDKAKAEYLRRTKLTNTGAISGETILQMKQAYSAAKAKQQLAQLNVEQCTINLIRTVIRSPVSGVVANRTVELGQQVNVGSILMSIVPIDQLYVDANFKENQVKKIQPGQSVDLYSDMYGDQVKYRGIVVGLAGGTGSAFSLIPAQNATGNWIKVVQRLPVRIKIDPKQLIKKPLRIGLSMHADVQLTSN
jgi:membrane fusion protein (multidrug efflux system)